LGHGQHGTATVTLAAGHSVVLTAVGPNSCRPMLNGSTWRVSLAAASSESSRRKQQAEGQVLQ